MKIVTIFDGDEARCLLQKAEEISLTKEGLDEAQDIANQLIETLKPLMPAAGLAAPQIGISKQIFIYSWDRSLENIEVAINPIITSVSDKKIAKWEACFSSMHENGTVKAAQLERFESLTVEYMNLEGQTIRKKLEGFAAKLFQHEYDHLLGIVNVEKDNIIIKEFSNQSDFFEFMQDVKQKDSVNYIKPIGIDLQNTLID